MSIYTGSNLESTMLFRRLQYPTLPTVQKMSLQTIVAMAAAGALTLSITIATSFLVSIFSPSKPQ